MSTSRRSRVLAFGFWLLAFGFWLLDSCYLLLATCYLLLQNKFPDRSTPLPGNNKLLRYDVLRLFLNNHRFYRSFTCIYSVMCVIIFLVFKERRFGVLFNFGYCINAECHNPAQLIHRTA